MKKQNAEHSSIRHVFSSAEIIEIVLQSLGLKRLSLSTYKQYKYPNGKYLRLRISNHGIYLQHWFDINKKARIDGQKVPKLNIGVNIAITFTPNKQECDKMGQNFPMKIKNITNVKTGNGKNAKPQFRVRHFSYNSWLLTKEDISAISSSLLTCVSIGCDYRDPLKGSGKVLEWEDISNLPPRRIQGKKLNEEREK